MEGMGGGGGVSGFGEQKDKLQLHVPSSESSLLNIICKILYTFTNPTITNVVLIDEYGEGGGGVCRVGEQNHKLWLDVPPSESSLLNIICNIVHFYQPFHYQHMTANSPK